MSTAEIVKPAERERPGQPVEGALLKQMNILSVRDVHLQNKRVLMRCDFNVPLDSDGVITDDTRIRATLPTIQFIRQTECRLILCSHLGRPKGKKTAKYSLEPVGRWLAEQLGCDVMMPDDCVGDSAIHLVANQRPAQVILLENLRFHAGEEDNGEDFARKLADLADVYVNDAFGAVHRAHASVAALPRLMPVRAAGLLMEKEIEYLTRLMTSPEAPYVALLGGAKVSDKIEVIESLIPLVQGLLIGGAMAYTFLAAQNVDVGKSLVEKDHVMLARHLLSRCEERGLPVFLPLDHVVVKEVKPDAEFRIARNGDLEPDDIAVDIGPETIALFMDVLGGHGATGTAAGKLGAPRTILWNGPMGIFEMEPFATGTMAVARAVAQSTATSVVGGGDSVSAVQQAGVTPMISHISTGGGASLEYLSGQPMPGIQALRGGRR